MEIWSAIGLAILSAAIPLIIAAIANILKKSHPEREFTFTLRSQARLPELDLGSKANLLELKWAGQGVDSLVVSRWRLINSGYQPIRKEDIDETISIQFPENDFLGASVYKGDPLELEKRVKDAFINTNIGFKINPVLWNTKESVDFTVVTKKPFSEINKVLVGARVVSGRVKLTDETQPDRNQSMRQQKTIFLAMGFASIVTAIAATIFALISVSR